MTFYIFAINLTTSTPICSASIKELSAGLSWDKALGRGNDSEAKSKRAAHLREALQRLGPAYVKFAESVRVCKCPNGGANVQMDGQNRILLSGRKIVHFHFAPGAHRLVRQEVLNGRFRGSQELLTRPTAVLDMWASSAEVAPVHADPRAVV